MRLPFTYPLRLPPSSGIRPAGWLTMIFSWKSLGGILVAVMLARWVWVFAAPKAVAMPATVSWQKSNAADNLFGQPVEVDVNAAAAASNIKLVGVFAHPTAGFAVLLVDGKQVGVGLGGAVDGGLRLAETHANYILLERGGIKQRVELQASTVASGITSAPANGAAIVSAPPAIAPQATEANSDLEKIPPEQRALMQQELDKFRRRN